MYTQPFAERSEQSRSVAGTRSFSLSHGRAPGCPLCDDTGLGHRHHLSRSLPCTGCNQLTVCMGEKACCDLPSSLAEFLPPPEHTLSTYYAPGPEKSANELHTHRAGLRKTRAPLHQAGLCARLLPLSGQQESLKLLKSSTRLWWL